MKNTFFIFSILAAAFAARANIILLDADLQNIAVPTTYTNNAIINASGAPHERLFVKVGVTPTNTDTCRVEVVQFDVNRKMLSLLYPETVDMGGRNNFMMSLHNWFPNPTPLSAKGNCFLEGQFDIVFGVINGNAIEVNCWLGHDEDPENGVCNFYFNTGNGPQIRYTTARRTYVSTNAPNFNVNQIFRMHFKCDLSKGLGSDFRWGFKATRLGTPAWEWGSTNITRSCGTQPSVFPDRFVIKATSYNRPSNWLTAPIVRFSNFQIKAYPKVHPTLFLLK